MNADGNESKSSMSKKTSVTLKEKGKDVVAEVEPTKEVTTAQTVDARDKAKDAPNTGPELFPESVPACFAKLTAQPVEAPDKTKDAPSTGPELFPESVPACVAELGSATSFKAPGTSNPEIIPMTTVAAKYERKLNANHHVAKIKASRKGGVLTMAAPDEDGPELLPETVKNPPFIVAKLGTKKYSSNDEDMVNANVGPAASKVKFDMDKSKPNKNTDVTKRARTTHAAASKTKHGMDVAQGMTFRIQEDDGSAPLTAMTSLANLSSNQTGDHQSAGAAVLTGNDEYVKRQAMAEQNRRSRERRKMRRQNASSKNEEDLNDERLPLSFPSCVGDNGGTKIPPPTLFSDQYDEMKVEEEEILSQLDKDESQQPGAFAVSGIGAADPSWQSMLKNPESQDSTENNQNTNNNQAHLSNEDMIPIMLDQQVSDGSENLISAIVVDDDAIPEAEAVSEEVLQRNKRRRTLCCLIGLGLLIVTIVLAVVLSRDTTSNKFSPAPSQSLVPSTLPSLSPSSGPTTTVRLFLEQVSPLSTKAFEDETSPQFKALMWLESNHTNLDLDYSNDRIIQRFALATLYYGTKGDQWIQSDKWLDPRQHECEWFSTHQYSYERCTDFKYDEIKLPSNRLKGFLPREIYLLSNLRVLDLSDNVLHKSLPSELGLLKNIKTINLNGNSFEGSLPTELGNLKASIAQLDLSSNNIHGKIPSVLGLLTGVESLRLDDNILSGTVISEIGMLSNLKTLSMMANNLDGTVPTQMAPLQKLEVLDLNDNLLSGALPLVFILPKLKELRARSNFITGTLPSVLAFMSNLQLLNLESNSLRGSIPSEMGLMSNLELLNMNSNRLDGSIPSEVGLVSNLELLNMNNNRLEGSIPSEIGQLVQLETLNLSGNDDISGILPTELGLLVRLETMKISQTRISGSIGTVIVGMENLKSLDLSGNELSGTIPETIMSLVKLESLDLAANRLSGSIPETLGSLVNLESLDLSFIGLSGTIPETIMSLVNLESLDLSFIGLSGTIPETIMSLVNLEFLDLRTNGLSGTIPETMGSLMNLESLNLALNRLSGMIPETMGSLLNLEFLYLALNRLSGTISETMGSLVNLEFLDLGTNRLSGMIPETMGSLVNLERLFLGFNKLSGPIPKTLGSLVNLDDLMIIFNDLTGEVPKELCELRRTNNIETFLIDCEEISCDCCFDGCPNPPRILNSTSSKKNCPDGMALLQVAIGTDRDPKGVEWDVVEEFTNKTLLQGGSLTQVDFYNTILQEICVPSNACMVFTIRGSNGDGYEHDNAGDRFMVHLNGGEVSNGRIEDFQKEEGFFFGETSYCVATDKRQACSVTHRTCDSTGLQCDLDNDGGLSGFCVPSEPSVSPPLISAPVVPITSPCTLCEDGSGPPNDTLVVPGYFTSERTIEQTCGKYNEYLLNQVFLSDSDECKANQATFGIACGCENAIASSEGACRLCGGTDIPRYPFKVIDGLGYYFFGSGDMTCLDAEYFGGTASLCATFTNGGKSYCCGQSCSNSEPCKEGYYCNFENGDDGICEFCGSPDEVSFTCSSLDSNSEEATDCAKSCIFSKCNTGYSSIRVDLTTGLFPGEISWTLQNESDGEIILQGNGYTDASITFVSQTCVKNDVCLHFTIYDLDSNRLSEGGGYVIYVNNEQVFSGRSIFGSSETKLIGSCRETAFPSVSPPPSSSMLTASPTINPTAIVEEDDKYLSPPCQDGMVNFTVEIAIENDPERVAWTVVNTNSGSTPGDGSGHDARVLLQGGPYNVNEEGTAIIVPTTFTESTCVVSDACLLFTIQDAEAVSSKLSFDSIDLESLLATIILYADSSKVAVNAFYGPTTLKEVGACSPIQ